MPIFYATLRLRKYYDCYVFRHQRVILLNNQVAVKIKRCNDSNMFYFVDIVLAESIYANRIVVRVYQSSKLSTKLYKLRFW